MSLATITELSHRYGADPAYVLAGGGNTSYKDEKYLYVKPSGVALKAIRPEHFVKMERAAIRACFELGTFADATEREAEVKRRMAFAVTADSSGRPSVEAPLHELLPFRYVVHLHPALINALTCARDGAQWAGRLFPEALWIDYVDPGFTLARRVGDAIAGFVRATGRAPAVLLLQNHGAFVGADTAEEVDSHYQHLMSTLRKLVPPAPPPGELDRAWVRDHVPALRAVFGDESPVAIRSATPFPVARGPLTPDHVVYAKSYALITADPTPEAVAEFTRRHGYRPLITEIPGKAVLAAGPTPANAATALQLARDASLVESYTAAFGGPHYLSDPQREFIENWEVESYRRKVAAGSSDAPLRGRIALLSEAAAASPLKPVELLSRAGAEVAVGYARLEELLLECGGVDLVVSTANDFEEATRLMAAQNRTARRWSDVVLLNYPAAVRVLAAQLLPDRIKVNGLNFEPGRGNPMNCDCTAPEAMRALIYLVEQPAETGTVLPVTGGRATLNDSNVKTRKKS